MIRYLLRIFNVGWAALKDMFELACGHPMAEPPAPDPQPGRRNHPHGFLFRDPREQMDANEFFEAEQSHTIRNLEMEGIAERTRLSETVRRLTPDGLAIEEAESLLRTTSGQLVSPQHLVGGGRCCVCQGYADREHYYHCAECGLGMCRLHVCAVEGVAYCPEHARQALYNLETWNLNEGRTPHDG